MKVTHEVARTKIRLELQPQEAVKSALSVFTQDGHTDRLRVYAGADRLVPNDLFHSHNFQDEIHEIKVSLKYLAATAHNLLLLSGETKLLDGSRGGGRLLIKPRDPQRLANLISRLDTIPLGEATHDIDEFVYVDFSKESLVKDVMRRRHAIANFKTQAALPSMREGFYAQNARLVHHNTVIPVTEEVDETEAS
jgi:hypothetical protein